MVQYQKAIVLGKIEIYFLVSLHIKDLKTTYEKNYI